MVRTYYTAGSGAVWSVRVSPGHDVRLVSRDLEFFCVAYNAVCVLYQQGLYTKFEGSFYMRKMSLVSSSSHTYEGGSN